MGSFSITDCNKQSEKYSAKSHQPRNISLKYQERGETLKLPPLKYRRQIGNMIALYNLLYSNSDVEFSNSFALSTNPFGARGHGLKLFILQSRLDIR